MEKRQFRADLYYRLNQVKFELPPLRKRQRDIVPLAIEFIRECCREEKRDYPLVHPSFLQLLREYPWPGNVRELRNEIRRAVVFCRIGTLTPADLSSLVLKTVRGRDACETSSRLAGEVAQTEQMAIEQMLREQNFNRAATARASVSAASPSTTRFANTTFG